MDAEVLGLAGPGTVAVLAGAAHRGSDYAAACSRAIQHYAALGANVASVPDPRESLNAALGALTDDVSLLVLPGGSPASLREMFSGELEARVIEMHTGGLTISGASAGAMVLCCRMIRPGGGAEPADVVDGLGLVEGLALPHWSPGSDRGWPVPDDVELWGLPECGGVVITGAGADRTVHAVGQGEPSMRRDGAWQPVGRGTQG